MTDNYIFEKYPVGETLPYHFDAMFEWLQSLAMNVLDGRSISEIAGLAMDVDRYVISRLDYLAGLEFPECLYSDPGDLYPGRNQIVALQWAIKRNEPIGSVSSLDNLRWVECFAAVVLSHVAFACLDEDRHSADPDCLPFEELAETIGTYALSCMEAATIIRTFPGDGNFFSPEQWMPDVQEERRRQAKNAAHSRHAPSDELKQRFVEWYLEYEGTGKFRSRNQAATKFHDSLSEQEQRVVTNPNTFLKALRSHLRTHAGNN